MVVLVTYGTTCFPSGTIISISEAGLWSRFRYQRPFIPLSLPGHEEPSYACVTLIFFRPVKIKESLVRVTDKCMRVFINLYLQGLTRGR